MRLGFNVQNQVISRFDSAYVVADSRNFLTAKFVFSTPEWSGKTKTAVFKQGDEIVKVILDGTDTCTIPWEVIRYPGFSVSVFAGDLITANIAQVTVTASGYTAASGTPPPTPDVYRQLISLIDDRRLIGPRGARGKQGLPGPPGNSDPTEMRGLLSSRLLTPDDYTTDTKFSTQTISQEETNTHFHAHDILHGGWWDFDSHPVSIISIKHLDANHWPHQVIAIPTDINSIEEFSFEIRDAWWRHMEATVEILGIEPFTTVEGFDSHKINGTVELESDGSTFDFAICIGFRLSPHEPTRGYALPKMDSSFLSSMYFKRTSGSANPLFWGVAISGGNASNTLLNGQGHKITFKEPLSEGDRISASFRFPVTVKSPNLTAGVITLPYQASLLWASAGYVGIHTSAVIKSDISCCPHNLYTEIEVDENGITATLDDRNQYEHWWSEVQTSCKTEVGYIEIITRR